MAYYINGRWKAGWALDLHTLSSTINSDGETYTTLRTEIGEALYLLKYCKDNTQINFLVDKITEFLKTLKLLPYIDVIIPVPASTQRELQPVYEICKRVGNELNILVDMELIEKVKTTTQLKSIEDMVERQKMISGAFRVTNPDKYRNKKILIIDDLFRSGTTLNELTNVLYDNANRPLAEVIA